MISVRLRLLPRIATIAPLLLCAFGSPAQADEKKPAPVPSVAPAQAPTPRLTAGEQADGSVLVTTNQMVTPLGKVQKLAGERPKDLAVSPDGSRVAVLT